jgi:hypothetical protein
MTTPPVVPTFPRNPWGFPRSREFHCASCAKVGLGEINDNQPGAWRKSIDVPEKETPQLRTLSLLPEDRAEGLGADGSIGRLKLSKVQL